MKAELSDFLPIGACGTVFSQTLYCPHCGHDHGHPNDFFVNSPEGEEQVIKCAGCARSFTATIGTIYVSKK